MRHAAQHRLTDQMRSDELLLKRLETSQQRGVLRKSQVRPPSRSALSINPFNKPARPPPPPSPPPPPPPVWPKESLADTGQRKPAHAS